AVNAHDLVAALLRAGFEVDLVSPEVLRAEPVDRYRVVLYLHPYGAKPKDLDDLEQRQRAGVHVHATGLEPESGHGFAEPAAWRERLGQLSYGSEDEAEPAAVSR